MSFAHAALFSARAAAWALLLMGWVGLGSLALVLAGSVLQAQALVALWLLAVGAAAAWWRPGRGGLAVAALVAVGGLAGALRGGGVLAVMAAMGGLAALLAAASGVVRRCRLAALARQPGVALPPPVRPAAMGALLAGVVLGDPGDPAALVPRLTVAVMAMAALLAVLPVRGGVPREGCRAGLFDCSLPAWPAGAWREPQRWPLLLATLAMLPMMASLPLVLATCRAEGWPPSAMLALHGLAMFAPALLVARLAAPAALVGSLLALAVPALALPGPQAMVVATLAQGAAWSLAWRAQLAAPRAAQAPRRPASAAFAAALVQAAWVLGVGAWLASTGPAGLLPLQAALGAAAALALVASYAGRKPSIER